MSCKSEYQVTKEKGWTVCKIEHKRQPQIHDWETPDFLTADRDDTVTWLRHIRMEGLDLLVWKKDTVSCRMSSGPLYQTGTLGVTTEITIEYLSVCKWQHNFTLRSVGKVGCGKENWNFLKPKPWELMCRNVTSAQTNTKCPICETFSEN